MTVESIPGLWPGEVDSYDGATRICRVRIPGVTDGSNALPQAVFSNPLGDRAAGGDTDTEIRILPGDPVWLMFECGDPRFPIIMGYRTPRVGNPVGWRRWRHKNVELTAEETLVINAKNVIWNIGEDVTTHVGGNAAMDVGGSHSTDVTGAMASKAGSSSHQAATHALTAATTISGALSTAAGPGGAGATLTGPVNITGGAVKHDGVNIGKTHVHTEQGNGADVSVPK